MKDSERPKKRRVQERSLVKRTQILEAASALFLELGFDAVSVDMVTERVGGTKGNVYTHFGSKAGLFAAVVEEQWKDSVQPFAEIEELDPEDPPLEEALRQLGRGFLRAILTDREVTLHRMIVSEARRHARLARHWYSYGPEKAYNRFTTYVEKQQKAGRLIGTKPARQLAPLFLDMLSSEMHMKMMIAGTPPPKRSEIDRIVDDCVEIFLYGAAAKARSRS
jgi:AcrR family transcriptional regulator